MSAAAHAVRQQPSQQTVRFDAWLITTVCALLAYGLIMVYSATIATGDRSLTSSARYLVVHGAHILIAGGLALGLAYSPIQWWERLSRLMLVAVFLSLVLLFIPGLGVTVNGSTRWVALGLLRFQPAELAKVMVVIYAAGYLTRKRELLGSFTHGVLIIGLVLAALAVLLLLQPDFGSFVVITATVGAMLFLAGIRLGHFALCVLVAGAAVVALTVLEPYRMNRVLSFMDPWVDPYDSGFQLVQALIALGRGEWFGVGLGASIQKLYYLPHANNDFLLAVIGEELGFAGVALVIALFGILLWRSFVIAWRAERAGLIFAARLAQGMGLLLVLQGMINIGVNLGALPTKGLTLPFMSYGGSSMVATGLAVGLLFAADRASRAKRSRKR